MIKKLVYLMIAVSVGGLFSWLQIPAGWLLGSILTGIISAFFVVKIHLPNNLFKLSLAMIGGTIGLMLRPEQFLDYHSLLAPFLFTLFLTLVGGVGLGLFLKRYSNLNSNTAFFCCLPGGASEVIGLSLQYGANQQIVAAFHTTRITLFVLVIPLVVGLQAPTFSQGLQKSGLALNHYALALFLLFVVMVLTIILSKKITFPGSSLFFAIGLGFIAHLLFPAVEMPGFIAGFAQGIMGAIIGMRFDKDTFKQIRAIGLISGITLLIYFLMSLALATVFYLLTPIGWFTSLLSIVPAGAAEMASTATALNIEPAMVATLQMARVLALFIALPFLIKLFADKTDEKVGAYGKEQ
ncbi:AbrB family transcriptional regulator [Halalkalibacter krulwichiae]|uniref:Putative ammonia monooxygenase n=1 Tax=Halalkalibacter krulwichiae TaxID=199441 RepID=A0A1X9M8P3_9BACI|nr:AbrB family transcriptional regulator [Halalkalibacter krulwichiae]ARK29766.1 Putative ammonia monooxygenase [Halalkalibacter krulwichiae]